MDKIQKRVDFAQIVSDETLLKLVFLLPAEQGNCALHIFIFLYYSDQATLAEGEKEGIARDISKD